MQKIKSLANMDVCVHHSLRLNLSTLADTVIIPDTGAPVDIDSGTPPPRTPHGTPSVLDGGRPDAEEEEDSQYPQVPPGAPQDAPEVSAPVNETLGSLSDRLFPPGDSSADAQKPDSLNGGANASKNIVHSESATVDKPTVDTPKDQIDPTVDKKQNSATRHLTRRDTTADNSDIDEETERTNKLSEKFDRSKWNREVGQVTHTMS